MKNLLLILIAIVAFSGMSSCTSKAEKQKEREQQIADSLRQDSIQKEQREEELKDDKIVFLKQFYATIIFPKDENIGSDMAYRENFTRHLSEKVAKALIEYDDGIEDGDGMSKDTDPHYYVFGDEGDYGNEPPKMAYEYEGKGWFKVTIDGYEKTILKIKVDSDNDDDEFFIITGLDIPRYDVHVYEPKDKPSSIVGKTDKKVETAGTAQANSGDKHWDEMLDDYEGMVNHFIELDEKAAKGDMNASAEGERYMSKISNMDFMLSENESVMTAKQQARFKKIQQRAEKVLGE